ncbi:hypothetical protein B0J14DRAFT_570903 [Halenospora varia]|nr:hypothetical protein B0J14DRAFT_570903 [Halenospora varia]
MPSPMLNSSDFDMCKELGIGEWEDVIGYQINDFLLPVSRPNLGYHLSNFDGISFHPVKMGRRHEELVADSVKHVTIIGGHKSALEAVRMCSQAGKKVEWDSKGNPMAKMAVKRAMGVFSTSVYHSNRWIDRFFRSGWWWLGTWLLMWVWGVITKQMQGDKYTKSENGRKLRPNPESEKFKMDAIVMCTGWELSSPAIFSLALAHEVGMPTDPKVVPDEEKKHWRELNAAAEEHIVKTYPILKNPPSNLHIPEVKLTPFRLFRFMVPVEITARGDNSLVFLGNLANGRLQYTSEIHSLWAYLKNMFPDSTTALFRDQNAMELDVAHVEAYRRKRYLNYLPIRLSISETPEYDEIMLGDLGLRSDCKGMDIPTGRRGWFGLKAWAAEWFEGYFAEDFTGIMEEFLDGVEQRSPRRVKSLGQADRPTINGKKTE